MDAALGLTNALRESGQLPEALEPGRETLITVQRVNGGDHGNTGLAAGALASGLVEMVADELNPGNGSDPGNPRPAYVLGLLPGGLR